MLALVPLLIVGRVIVAAHVPLVPDEAYYVLWSRHLSAGYLDHPPMIALFIRIGTTLLGESTLGVRLVCLLAALPTSWFIARSAERLLGDYRAGLLAMVVFNVTPMGFFGMALATPDAPLMLFSSAMVYAAVRLIDEDRPRWWLGLGLATGLALQSKYSAGLLAAGIAVAVFVLPDWRRKLLTPWPWLALLVAMLVFAPNVIWNAQHGWDTFAKQGGRTTDHWHLAPQFLPELIAAQLGLATPLVFVLALLGLTPSCRPLYRFTGARTLVICMVLTPTAYFVFHALRSRVEGNWPGFLYPALAITATAAMLQAFGDTNGHRRRIAILAIPLALVIIAVGFVQATAAPFTGLGRKDPITRMTRGWTEFAVDVDTLRRSIGASYVLTDNYQLNAELALNLPGIPVEQVNERRRYGFANEPPPADLPGIGLFVGDPAAFAELRPDGTSIVPLGTVARRFEESELARWSTFRIEWKKESGR